MSASIDNDSDVSSDGHSSDNIGIDEGYTQPDWANAVPYFTDAPKEDLIKAVKKSHLKQQELAHELKGLRAENSALAARKSSGKTNPPPHKSMLGAEEKAIQYAGERFAFAHELYIKGETLDKPCPPGVDTSSPGRYDSDVIQEIAALTELYESLSPDLRIALATPSRRESFKQLFMAQYKKQRAQLVHTARVVAGNVLRLSPESASNIQSSNPSDRANDRALQGLLRDPSKPGEKYPQFPPLLYANSECLDVAGLFQTDALAKYLKAVLFGKASINHGTSGRRKPKHVLWNVKKTTPGMIATAATILTFVCGPDKTFGEKGDATGIEWKTSFSRYKYTFLLFPEDHRSRLLAWYNKQIFNDTADTTLSLEANAEPTKVHTNEIEDLIQQLRYTDVQQSPAPPVLPSQPLAAALPSALIPGGEESVSSESGPSPIADTASRGAKGKLRGSGDSEQQSVNRYPSKSRRVSTRRVKGTA